MKISVSKLYVANLKAALGQEERILWMGSPGYGQRLSELVQKERVWWIALMAGIICIWASLPFFEEGWQISSVAIAFSVLTVMLLSIGLFFSLARQRVLSSLTYFATNHRVIIIRTTRDWRFRRCLFVIAAERDQHFEYRLLGTKPFDTIWVGSLLSPESLQPYGFGLAHPGLGLLVGRNSFPLLLEYIQDAPSLVETLKRPVGG